MLSSKSFGNELSEWADVSLTLAAGEYIIALEILNEFFGHWNNNKQ